MTNQEKLQNRDYVVLIDRSGSMGATDTPNGSTRWKYAEESTKAIARKLQEYDPDGITVIPFASTFKRYENTKADVVSDVFAENEPMGGTVLAPVMKNVFSDYLARKKKGETKSHGEIMVVITDGEPEDEQAVAKAIIDFTKQLENGDDEYGISFIQVGKDMKAAAFLQRLDDHLEKEGAKFDIVDTKTMEDVEKIGLTETLIAALED